MKKRLLTLVFAVIVLVLFFTNANIAFAEYDGVENSLAKLQEQFPEGKHWNHLREVPGDDEGTLRYTFNNIYGDSVTDVPCVNHARDAGLGEYGCNAFDGASQCFGFANRIFYGVFGQLRRDLSIRTDIDNIRVGDHIRFTTWGNSGHSAIVCKRDGDTLTLCECNYGNQCGISWSREVNLKTSGIIGFYHASNWDEINRKHNNDNVPPEYVSNIVTITGIHSKGFTANYQVSDNEQIKRVGLTIWPDEDDTRMYSIYGSYDNNTHNASVEVNIEDVGYLSSKYRFTVFAEDIAGNRAVLTPITAFSLYAIDPAEAGSYKAVRDTSVQTAPFSSFNGYSTVAYTLKKDEQKNVLGSYSVDGVKYFRLEAYGADQWVKAEDMTYLNVWDKLWNSIRDAVSGEKKYAYVVDENTVYPVATASESIVMPCTLRTTLAYYEEGAEMFSIWSEVEINNTTFPDSNFRNYIVKNFDLDNDGILTKEEIAEVREITIGNASSLEGIENFYNLETLDCNRSVGGGGNLKSFDVSRNFKLVKLLCEGNGLTSLIVSNNLNLQILECQGNQLDSLDISQNAVLKKLECSRNNISTLDTSQNTALEYLGCQDSMISSLDVRSNTALIYLNCNNVSLANLDVSQCINLEELYCNNCSLREIDVSKNSKLNEFWCNNNHFTALDVSNNAQLGHLYCVGNQLESIDVTHNLELWGLSCGDNKLTELDVSKNVKLLDLSCFGNAIQHLDLSNNPLLQNLRCYNNQLANLDLGQNVSLNYVTAYDNSRIVSSRFDVSTLPGFDLSRASNWSGGYVDSNNILVAQGETVTYDYDCGSGFTVTFTLIPSGSSYVFPEYRFYGTPEDLVVPVGESFTLAVETSGEALTYRWLRKAPSEDSFSEISNTASTLNIVSEPSIDGYQYKCIIVGRDNSIETESLTITPVYKHTMQAGETISGLCNNYGVTFYMYSPAIKILNHIKAYSDVVVVGYEILLPVSNEAARRIIVESHICGDDLFWELDSDGTLTISGTGKMYEYSDSNLAPWFDYRGEIRKVILTEGVTSIGAYAFQGDIFNGYPNFKEISFPSTLMMIGNNAFAYCSGLEEVRLPDALTSVSSDLFRLCNNLRSVYIPEGVTSIGSYAFYMCSSLSDINIPDGVTVIDANTFSYCSSLTHITIPESVTKILQEAFNSCRALSYVFIPENVTLIQTYAFTNCESLLNIDVSENNSTYSSVDGVLFSKDLSVLVCCPAGKSGEYVIPDSASKIGFAAFQGCSKITRIVIPESVKTIESMAFWGCAGLTEMTLPNDLTDLGGEALAYCSCITRIVLPDTITSIYGTFLNCESLREVFIPVSVTLISGRAFDGCDALQDVYYDGTEQQWNAIEILNSPLYPNGNDPLFNANIHFNGIAISEANFPDANFRQYLSQTFDTDKNGYLSRDEIEAVTSINTYQYSISSFDGIGFFTDLVDLSTGWQPNLTRLDVSHNGKLKHLDCNSCGLEELVTTGAYNLNELFCSNNHLTEIDLSNNTALTRFSINHNPLTKLDVSHNPNMKSLHCDYSNLTELNTAGATALEYLSAYSSNLQRLNITQNHQLWRVDVGQNRLTSLDLSGNPNLTWLGCEENQLSSLDISHNPQLSHLFCYSNNIAEIAIEDNPVIISIINNGTKTDNYGPNGDMVMYDQFSSETNRIKADKKTVFKLNSTVDRTVVASGNCGAQGDNLTWVLYDDGELVISGTGAMMDYDYTSTDAWRPYKSSISSVVIENGATTIGKFAFHECTSLTKVVIPESVRTIMHQAFWGCSGLTELMIPEGVTMLGAQSFAECTGLSSVAIPSSVVEIRSSAFDECSGLMNIYVSSDNAVYCDIDGVLFSKDKTEIVTFPCGRSGAYDIPIILPNGVTKIGDDAFASCKKITSITVPVGVTTIGERAFQGCLQLTDVSLPVGLKLIDSWGFSGCKSLKHIDLPDGVETIEWGAFYCCYDLESISLPATLKSIAESTFGYDSKLRDVYYGGTQDQWNLISIADYYNEPLNHATIHFAAIDLIEFVLPSSLSFIESEAFAGINAQVIVIPASVGAIESRAFADCPNLVMLYFEGSPNKIAKDAIDGCGTVTVSARQYSSAIAWATELGLPVIQHD